MPQRLEYTVLDMIESAARTMKAQPLNLGGLSGTGGGVGAPPAGYIGQLPQTRVAYDETEDATLFTPASGMSLLDNLNHIRYRIGILETSSGILTVDEWDGNPTVELVEHLTFSGAVTVTEIEPGHALVVITASGGGDPNTFVPYVGATQDVNLGNRNFTVSGVSRLGRTQIREGQYLQIGANENFDSEIKPTTSYIAFGDSFVGGGGGYVRIFEPRDDAIAITVDGHPDFGKVLLAGYTDGYTDIEALIGDIDEDFHGYYLKIYSGGAEFNSNVNIPSGYTYNIAGVPHTHSGGGSSLTVQNLGGGTVVNNVDKITFYGPTIADQGNGDVLVFHTPLTVEEADGIPSVAPVNTIIFSGAYVTDLGGGEALVTISGNLHSHDIYARKAYPENGIVNRILPEDTVVASGYGATFVDYLNLNGFDLDLVGDAAVAIINGTLEIPFDDEYIRGLEITWNSATSITIGKGQAWNKGTNSMMTVNSVITKSSLSLSASTWYYLYLYDNSGTLDIDVSTTIPTIDGHHYSYKTGTTTRRCVGAILTDGSSNVYKFISKVRGNDLEFVWIANSITSPMRVLSAGNATTPTSVSLTGVLPDVIYSEYRFGAILILAATNGDMSVHVHNDANFSTATNDMQYYTRLVNDFGSSRTVYLPPSSVILTARSIHYATVQTAGANTFYIDSKGFTVKR